MLAVVGQGDDLSAARAEAYDVIGRIQLDGAFYRTDIALAERREEPMAISSSQGAT